MLATAPGCELDVERGPDWLLVRVRNLDPTDSETASLADHLWSLLEQHFTHRLVLELDEVDVLSSSLIGQFAELYRRIEEHDGVMRLCGLSANNRELLHACRLDERLPPYGNRKEAVMARLQWTKPR
jgi:anti-anti-sigma factor